MDFPAQFVDLFSTKNLLIMISTLFNTGRIIISTMCIGYFIVYENLLGDKVEKVTFSSWSLESPLAPFETV